MVLRLLSRKVVDGFTTRQPNLNLCKMVFPIQDAIWYVYFLGIFDSGVGRRTTFSEEMAKNVGS